ncbi:venom dipeptidyl peptidase 4-like isoform X2 [Contarinia nasturtii]|uniref:venom dipeptidyl peptidase 4-like isoform X2 n=1 Tax=Contarinia nasturtii TaxID=265458 RepID=UPI0012D426D5|nr:venom dipeptidyl peptidase 4-like isoform X2 [Contarinia nasturtii]XP_031621026.1 venom dipeptidyl peptidase 4-like isoform X2 [Contarinia nasturtii]XP_031621027.1 venom dipeptidyl peptidase 4-like isoform X2 [Contarinia nasturtii]XP_031621028.1 venom dipeptidyl peptidase 4-like isoform X2 [Contarinia nasturtii]XP_031621029.1 venom dipeptidyl peptidase 4-like isoform X2 [Contarinia nasturtii]
MPGSHGNSIEIGQSEQELVSAKNRSRLKKRLCIALTILCVVGLCVAGLIYYGAIKPEVAKNKNGIGLPISLNDVLGGKYYARHNNATWISDTLLFYRDFSGNMVTFNVITNKTEILAEAHIAAIASSFSQEISPDHRFLLLGRDYQKIYRHSALAHYDILDLKTKELYKLSDNLLALAEWGPIDNSILYIQENNIYYKPSVVHPAIQITNDGSANIYNGICDWVYEEEIFSTKTAAWISPDNKKLAYVQFDDSPVNHIAIPVYGAPGSSRDQYPGFIDFPYPKTGTNNPLVKLFLVDLTTVSPNEAVIKIQILPPQELREKQHIISVVLWGANNDTLLSTWMNRVQNRAIVEACEGEICRRILDLSSSMGWIDFFKPPTFNKNGSHFVYITPQFQKDANDSYQHLTLVSLETGKQTILTSGEFVVLEVLNWSEDTNTIFYAANSKNSSYIKHIWSVQVDDPSIRQCLTCNITRGGVLQTYFSAKFSPNSKHIVINNDGPAIPRTDIVRLSSHNSSELIFLRNWENNHGLHSLLAKVSTPIIKYHQIPLKNGFEAVVKLQLPPDVDTSGKTKYPMIIDVYAGPGSQSSLDRWEISFSSYLVTSQKYILAQIDGRGSGNRGQNLLHTIYRAMGTVEVEDQIETTKKLTDLFPFIDESRVAIWGWSYGGFTAGMALATDNANVFKCAASVAPVTDWLYYDTMYTERYMGLPFKEDNAQGYDRARLSTKAEEFRNKTYLLVHGSLDDNVHYQQSMALARSLELNDIPFEQITYPDEDHSLWGVRRHLYHKLDAFFAKCFSTKNSSSSK